MTIGELRRKLDEYPDDMEVLICHGDGDRPNSTDIDHVYLEAQHVGVLTSSPRVYDALVLDTLSCGL